MNEEIATDYAYTRADASHTHAYLWKSIRRELLRGRGRRVFDLGCGNGSFARHLKGHGFEVTGVDPSGTGIEIARQEDPTMRLELGSAYEDLASHYGTFPAVVSLEVVEHVYSPRKYARCVHDLLEPGGLAIISTPYHGYIKNLALALSGKLDAHFTALWDHGHIKFWSVKTLTTLFAEQGLVREKILRMGRCPILAKSMILMFRKNE